MLLSLSLSLSPEQGPFVALQRERERERPVGGRGDFLPCCCSRSDAASRVPFMPTPPTYSAAIRVSFSDRIYGTLHEFRFVTYREFTNALEHVSRGFPEHSKIVQSPDTSLNHFRNPTSNRKLKASDVGSRRRRARRPIPPERPAPTATVPRLCVSTKVNSLSEFPQSVRFGNTIDTRRGESQAFKTARGSTFGLSIYIV